MPRFRRAFPVLLIAGVLTALATAGATRTDEPTVVRLVAERFSFRPSLVRLELGQTLRLELRSEDTTHGFHILGTDIDVRVPRRGRGTVTVAFTPQKPGRYRFECSTLCGAGHNFMRGEIVVDDPDSPDASDGAAR